MSKKQPWARVLAQDVYELPQHLGPGREHRFPGRGCSVHAGQDTHVYLEAVIALHCKLRHIRARTEVDFSVKVISLQAQPPARTSVLRQL